jgi:arylsulfatase
VAVTPGKTLRLAGTLRGERVPDVAGLHLHLLGASGPVETARRRIETTDARWEEVDIRATVPAALTRAQVCLDVRTKDRQVVGKLQLGALRLTEIEARSRTAKLALPRIVLVTVEAFNRTHASAFGYPRPTTPSLAALVKEGTSWEGHRATAPYTHPSLASLLTGRLPTSLGFADNTPPSLGPRERTMGELLAEAGYVTAGFSSQYVLSNRWGLNRGFHYWRNHVNDTPGKVLTAELLPWLDAHAEDNVFTWVHYFDPHGPYRPPAGFRERFMGDSLWNSDTAVLRADPKAAEGVPAIPNYIADKGKEERRWYVSGYDGDLAAFDTELGALVRTIRTRGWERDTLVIVTADHGESMTEHDRYFCHGSLYEHDLHVPLVFWAPGRVTPGKRVDAPSSHVDVLPTVLDLAGLLPPAERSRSLRVDDAARLAVSTHGKGALLRYAVTDASGQKLFVDAQGKVQKRYDLKADPGERLPLSGLPPRASKALEERFRKLLASGWGAAAEVRTQSLDDEDLERLRALGYIE